jgi:hypothetical protein
MEVIGLTYFFHDHSDSPFSILPILNVSPLLLYGHRFARLDQIG